mgnify:CR=1 FL=1
MNGQSWHTCKYAKGDLHPDISEPWEKLQIFKLVRAIFPDSDWERLLKEKGINRFYFCDNTEMIGLAKKGAYALAELSDTKGAWKPYASLFSIDLSGYYGCPTGTDPFDEETSSLKSDIAYGLRMCANCRFHENA